MISQQELTEEYSLQAAYDERRKSHQFLVRLDCADLEDWRMNPTVVFMRIRFPAVVERLF